MGHIEQHGDAGGGQAAAAVVVIDEGQNWIANSPWWLVSAAVHVVILLAATLVTIERLMTIDEGEVLLRIDKRVAPSITSIPRDTGLEDRSDLLKCDDEEVVTQDKRIFFPGADPSDKNRSDNDDDLHDEMMGDDLRKNSYLPGESDGPRGRQPGANQGWYDTMGVGGGGGGGGRYGGRFGSNRNTYAVGRPGPTKATEDAVIAALKWLARHQSPDGSWKAQAFNEQCVGAKCAGAGIEEFDTGLTALSLLAFLGAGYTHLSHDEFPDPVQPSRRLRFGEAVKKAMQWLVSQQDPEGCLGPRIARYMYNHAIGALALSEAYGMTSTQLLREPAQKAIDFLIAAQNPGLGWRYSQKSGDNDTSVTGWAVMALKSAELSDIPFPRSTYEGAMKWLTEATDDIYYRVGYTARGTGKVSVAGKNDAWDHHESMTAVSIMSRIFINKEKRDPALQAASMLVADVPQWATHKIDYYYWYYASLALFQLDGPDGPMWRKWNQPMKEALVPHQKSQKDGCQHGSWTSEDDRWGFEGGRVYAVAINALTLEVYYRYANVFGVSGKK